MKFPGPGAVATLPSLPYLDGGNMQLVMGRAQKCFDDINQLSCGQGGGSNTLQQTYSDCVAGAVGKLAVGATGCKGSPECGPNGHCVLADGGLADGTTLGVCRANGTTGQQCPFGNYGPDGNEKPGSPGFLYESQASCGYLLSGSPDYCANYDTNYGYNTSTTTCQPRAHVTPDAGCYLHVECDTLYCEGVTVDRDADILYPGHCSNGALIGAPAVCASALKTPDAGADANAVQAEVPAAAAFGAAETEAPRLLHKVRTN